MMCRTYIITALFQIVDPVEALSAPASVFRQAPSDHSASSRKPFLPYKLQSVKIEGSHRVDSETLADLLNLIPGTALDDDFVMNTRMRLIGIGLFEDVYLTLQKGDQAGRANLIVHADDDPSVLTDYGLGAALAITHGETQLQVVNPEAPPLGYKITLLSRNAFRLLHKAKISVDFDSLGLPRDLKAGYEFPSFGDEGVHFGLEYQRIDLRHRFLEAQGFGTRFQALWSKKSDLQSFAYGVKLVQNESHQMVEGFPTLIVGPTLSYTLDSKPSGFYTLSGYQLSLGVLAGLQDDHTSLATLGLNATELLFTSIPITPDISYSSTFRGQDSSRCGLTLEVPMRTADNLEQAAFFIQLLTGIDQSKSVVVRGTSALIGIRYHSPGLIAQVGIKFASNPKDLLQKGIP